MTDLMAELRLKSRDSVRVYLNDQMVGEFVLGVWNGRDSLQQEVERARMLRALPQILTSAIERLRTIRSMEDHNYPGEEKKGQAFIRGFIAGLQRQRIPSGAPGVPSFLPECSPSYETGYDYGETIARIVAAAESEGR